MCTAHMSAPCRGVSQRGQTGGRWVHRTLTTEQAVGVLGGQPKCCKTFLALDIAVSVASGAPCLRQFSVHGPGPVLMFPAEDALEDIRLRLDGICAAANQRLETIPIHVITVPRLYLDQDRHRQQLAATVQAINPRLLILDPFIRLHAVDENHACEIAPILSFLRDLQRRFHTAVLLIHHTKKAAGKDRLGQALRGSSDLHGWGDSNLYLNRSANRLQLSVEHRAAPSHNGLWLQLHENGSATALRLCDDACPPPASTPQQRSPDERIIHALSEASAPLPMAQLRKRCGMRTSTLCSLLRRLTQQDRVRRSEHGLYSLARTSTASVSLSLPL